MDLMNNKHRTIHYGKEIVKITNKHKKTLGIELLRTNTLSLFFENYYQYCEETGCKKGCRQVHKKHFQSNNSSWLGIDISHTSVKRLKKLYDSPVLQQWVLCDDENIGVGRGIIDAYQDGMTYEECVSKARINKNKETNNDSVKKSGFSQSDKKLIEKKQLHKCANYPGSNFEMKYNFQCLLYKIEERKGNFGEEGCEIDHILPVSKGGCSNIENAQALCLSCHRVKSNFENKERYTP